MNGVIDSGVGEINSKLSEGDGPGRGEVVVIQLGAPACEVIRWTDELSGLAAVRSGEDLGGVNPAMDTLVVTYWPNPVSGSMDAAVAFPDLSRAMLPSTRVVGIFLDVARATALAAGEVGQISSLTWLRGISDMVVVSSDVGAVVELVTTLAKAAG